MRYETQIRDDEYAATFVHHLRQFRDRQVMTDVTFKLHGKAIVCHKVVLGALSPILLDIFSKKKHSMSGTVFEVKFKVLLGQKSRINFAVKCKFCQSHTKAESVPVDTLAALVEFVYNSEAQLDAYSLTKLADATSKLGMAFLLDKEQENQGRVTIRHIWHLPNLLSLLSITVPKASKKLNVKISWEVC